MYSIGEKVLDKKTNELVTIISKNHKFYLVKDNSNMIIGKFEWEIKKCSKIKRIWKEWF